MKKTFYLALVMALGLTACDRDDDVKAPPVVTTMTRELDFTVTGAEKDTVYTTASKINSEAGFTSFTSSPEKNTFYAAFKAGPHVDNSDKSAATATEADKSDVTVSGTFTDAWLVLPK